MSSQQQTHPHTQNYLTSHLGYVCGPSTARDEQPNYIPSGPPYAQQVPPHYDSQPFAGDFRNMTSTSSTQFQRGDDAYWGNSMNDLNYRTTQTLRTEAPQPWNGGQYAPPQFQYGHFGQGGINHTEFPFDPSSNVETNVSHSFPGTSAASSNQGASPVWKLSNCWVNHETQDELRLTIVFRKGVPFT